MIWSKITQALPDRTLLRIADQDDLRASLLRHTFNVKKKRRIDRKGPVVRAEIDTALFAQISAQSPCCT